MYHGIITKFKSSLPVSEDTPIISLQEGNTPLIKANNLCKKLNIDMDLYFKYEGLNPTGSFKDRGMTLAISKAVEEKKQAVVCASTGNTSASASASAYAARAGLKCFVIIPEGKIALGKLAQALMHGAKVLQIRGNFDQGLSLVKQLAEQLPLTIVNSINPYRLQGQKTAALEIVEALNLAPDYHCIPVGNAANIVSYWMGYNEANSKILPKMVGYQAEGAAPFLAGKFIDEPETVATAIRIGHPQSWKKANEVQQQSKGWFAKLSDREILDAQQLLAASEGVFVEPASAAAVAGFINDVRSGKIAGKSKVVCTLTGNGLKDPDIAIEQHRKSLQIIEPNIQVVKNVVEEYLN